MSTVRRGATPLLLPTSLRDTSHATAPGVTTSGDGGDAAGHTGPPRRATAAPERIPRPASFLKPLALT